MYPPDPGDTGRICRLLLPLSVPVRTDTLILSLASFLVFLLLCALCSAMEEAMLSSSGSKLRQLAENGSRRAAKVLAAGENESRFCSAMQAGRICFVIAAAAALYTGFAHPLQDLLLQAGLPTGVSLLSALILIAAAIFLLLPFGVWMPAALAGESPEDTAVRLISFAGALQVILTPLTAVSRWFTNIAVRLSGGDPNAPDEDVTEEEIREMVDAGEVNGAIEETEKDMIANILDFNDTTAGEVMTHRTDVIAVEDSETPARLVELAMENGFSRIPIYHEDLDSILGICHIKDYLAYIGRPLPEDLTLTSHMRTAYFIPESKKCSQLFTEMTENKIQMAVVVDEYGGTAGIISMEDLVESIVGNIQDEYDHEEEMEIQKLEEHLFSIDGSTPVEEVEDLTGEPLPEGDYDTVAGFVVEQIGTIPKEGEHPEVRYRSLLFTVDQVEDRRITRLLLRHDPDWQPEDDEADDA